MSSMSTNRFYSPVFYKYATETISGGYISASELGRPAGAKGDDYGPSIRAYMPIALIELGNNRQSVVEDEADLAAYVKFPNMSTGNEIHNTEFWHEFVNSNLRSYIGVKVDLSELKGQDGYAWTEWDSYTVNIDARIGAVPNDASAEQLHHERTTAQQAVWEHERSAECMLEEKCLNELKALNIPGLELVYTRTNVNGTRSCVHFQFKINGGTYTIDIHEYDTVEGKVHDLLNWIKYQDNLKNQAAERNAVIMAERMSAYNERGEVAVLKSKSGKVIQTFTINQRGEVHVPEWAMGHLIGRGGSEIKGIQKTLNRTVKLVKVTADYVRGRSAEWLF